MKCFGDLLRTYRQAAGFSREELADRARISERTISALERGARKKPYRDTIAALAIALGLPPETRVELERAALRRGPGADWPDGVARNNLPPQLTSFVDREQVLPEIKDLFETHRLVTLVGTGGSGKTRCALEIAEMLGSPDDDGVWLADLAPISDSTLVVGVIACALSVQQSPNRSLLDALLAYLKRKRLLLIVDNCEHVIDEACRVVAAILHGCADVRILATSRERLVIAGECAYRMPSLPVPPTPDLLSAEEMCQYGAVQLFADRAGAADNRFSVSVESAPHVAEICRRLNGIPLAIELAAARVKVLSPQQLALKLDEHFRVLTGGDRSALPRQQTMRATIDWSHDLLSNDERRLFRKLSIFADGFTLESACAVCVDDTIDEIGILDLLSSLVDKSVVQAEHLANAPRYRLLESMRQYAHERLVEAGEREIVARLHATTFLRLAEELERRWETTPDRAWSVQVEPELENFRVALSWALGAGGDVLIGQRLAGTMRCLSPPFAPHEGQQWVKAAQRLVDARTSDATIAALDLSEAHFATVGNQYKEGQLAGERALSRYRSLRDARGVAVAQRLVGFSLVMLGKVHEGETLLQQSLAESRALGMHKLTVRTLQCLALQSLVCVPGVIVDLGVTRQLYAEALSIARTVGFDRQAAYVALNLAETEFRATGAAAALQLESEALAGFRMFRDTRGATNALNNETAYLVALRRYDAARKSARTALEAELDMQWSVGVAFTLQHVAAISTFRPSGDIQLLEDRRRAAHLLGYVDVRLAALEASREYTEQQEYDAMVPALRDALDEDELTRLMAEGSTWSEDQAVAEAMLI